MAQRALQRAAALLLLLAPAAWATTSSDDVPLGKLGDGACQPQQGADSFGILYASDDDPVRLRPIDLLRADAGSATPVANPVLTPAQLGVAAIAEPQLLAVEGADSQLYMFFAALPCGEDARWGIASVRSDDGGLSWQAPAWALRKPGMDLRAPVVFGHNEHWYMVPQIPAEVGEVWLYRASPSKFPRGFKFTKLLVEEALSGVNIVRHNHKWWLVGSAATGNGHDGEEHQLRLLKSKSPLGPWEPHLGGLLAAENALTMGPIFKWKNSLHRLGRACRGGQCGGVEVNQVFISEEAYEQDTLQIDLGRPLWRQQARWDGAGWSHLAIAKRSDGVYVAALAASRLPPVEPQLPGQLLAAIQCFKALAAAAIAVLLLTGAARVQPLRSLLLRLPGGRWSLAWATRLPGSRRAKVDETPPSSPAIKQAGPMLRLLVQADHCNSPRALAAAAAAHGTLAGMRPRSSGGLARSRSTSGSSSPGSEQGPAASGAARGSSGTLQRLRRHLPRWQPALAVAALAIALAGVWGCRTALRVAEPFWVQPQPVPVGGQYSKFTLTVMSYDKRLRELQWYVRHYSQCPSVGEVLVVWNQGEPPHPRAAFDSAVPVRVRVEPRNSMNNRFKPDAGIKFRAVLSLDDDILMPCADVERAFALWRASPRQLVGWYPRLLQPAGGKGAEGPPVYQFEPAVFKEGRYSAILAGAAFMDSAALFPAYWSPALEPARALVDEVFNCDDLLMNFVAANLTRAEARAAAAEAGEAQNTDGEGSDCGPPAVRLVRPQRRLDLSRLSGVGISHNQRRFKAAADRCLAEFSQLFGGSPLQARPLEPGYGAPPRCDLLHFDCMYLE